MFSTGNGPGHTPNMYSQPPLQPMLNQPQVQPLQTYYNCLNPTLYYAQFPPLPPNQTTPHHIQLSQTNQQTLQSNATDVHSLPTPKTKFIINTTQADPTQHRLRVDQRRQFRPQW